MRESREAVNVVENRLRRSSRCENLRSLQERNYSPSLASNTCGQVHDMHDSEAAKNLAVQFMYCGRGCDRRGASPANELSGGARVQWLR